MANCRAKHAEIWDLWVVAEYIWGAFDRVEFK